MAQQRDQPKVIVRFIRLTSSCKKQTNDKQARCESDHSSLSIVAGVKHAKHLARNDLLNVR